MAKAPRALRRHHFTHPARFPTPTTAKATPATTPKSTASKQTLEITAFNKIAQLGTLVAVHLNVFMTPMLTATLS